MLVSRTIAKQRMAANARPSFVGAWGLVLLDAALLVFAFLLLFRPFQYVVETFALPTFMVVLALVLLVFIPMQAILIVSALWAAKSRWVDTDDQR